jgi:phosphatidylinositol glycan class B
LNLKSVNRERLLRVGTIVERIRQAIEPGEIGLGQYLCLALLVRIPAVFFSRGYDFLDHQYQYIDPAYHVGLGGSWFLYHDYVQGLRSWVYPLILAGVFKLIAWAGITEPQVMMTVTRLIHGLISLIPVAAFWTLVVRWMGWQGQRPLLLFFAANWILVYSGVQPTGPTFAVGIALTAVFLFHGPGRLWPFVSGLLLGLAFSCRFQDAFFGPVLLGAGLLQRRWRESVFFCLGCTITITMQGLVDLFTWGSFLHSPFRYVAWNVFEGKMQTYGVQPWWLYGVYVCAVLVLVPPFLRSGIRALVEGAQRLPVLFAASAFYISMLNLVVRKDFRFVFHALILLLIVYASSLLRREKSAAKLGVLHRRVFITAHLVVLVLVSFWYPMRGPIEAAVFLSKQPDFMTRLVVVDGANEDAGGHFYLQRKKLDILGVEQEDLEEWLQQELSDSPLYILTIRHPLKPIVLPEGYVIEERGAFSNWPDLQGHARRFLYRIRRADGREETN